MLVRAETLKGYRLDSRDGEIAKVKELYFDDQYWAIRYLVADTGNWLVGRQVLISPAALGAVNHEEEVVSVDLTKEQIEDSPPLETDAPVSRQYEETFHRYQGLPTYWNGPYMWGAYPDLGHYRAEWGGPTHAEQQSGSGWEQSAQVAQAQDWDPHLRSTRDVSGHHIETLDDDIGHVEDFIIDDETWAIRYLVIDTLNWWSTGKKVLISPQWIERISWDDSKVYVNVASETIKDAPEYTESSPLTRDYETALYHHYDRHEYWATEPAAEDHSR
jgi:hypothetical protein